MSWNYRLMAEICPSGEFYITIHKVSYSEDGTIKGYAAEPSTIGGEDKSEVKQVLNWMQEALKKPILWKGDKFPQECEIKTQITSTDKTSLKNENHPSFLGAVSGSAFCPKDLMIGNFVNRKFYNPHPTNPSWELEKCEVVGIRGNSVILKLKGGNHSNHDYWEGINITGYMLEEELNFNCANRSKMVFKKYHNEENSDCTYIQLKEVGNPIWVVSFHNRWTVNPFAVEIEFLHQLQNLYRLFSGHFLICP